MLTAVLFAAAVGSARPSLREMDLLRVYGPSCTVMHPLNDGGLLMTDGAAIYLYAPGEQQPAVVRPDTPPGLPALRIMALAGVRTENPRVYTVYYWCSGMQIRRMLVEVPQDKPYEIRTRGPYPLSDVKGGPYAPNANATGGEVQLVAVELSGPGEQHALIVAQQDCAVYVYLTEAGRGFFSDRRWTKSPGDLPTSCRADGADAIIPAPEGSQFRIVPPSPGDTTVFVVVTAELMAALEFRAPSTPSPGTPAGYQPQPLVSPPRFFAEDVFLRHVLLGGTLVTMAVVPHLQLVARDRARMVSYGNLPPYLRLYDLGGGEFNVTGESPGRIDFAPAIFGYDVNAKPTVVDFEIAGDMAYFLLHLSSEPTLVLAEYDLVAREFVGRTEVGEMPGGGSLHINSSQGSATVCTRNRAIEVATLLDECKTGSGAALDCALYNATCIDNNTHPLSRGDIACHSYVFDECERHGAVCLDLFQICFDPLPNKDTLDDWQCICPNNVSVAATAGPAQCPQPPPWDECVMDVDAHVCAEQPPQLCVDTNPSIASLGDWLCMCTSSGTARLGARMDCREAASVDQTEATETDGIAPPPPTHVTETSGVETATTETSKTASAGDECEKHFVTCLEKSSETRKWTCIDPDYSVDGNWQCFEYTRNECALPCSWFSGNCPNGTDGTPNDVCGRENQSCSPGTAAPGDWECRCPPSIHDPPTAPAIIAAGYGVGYQEPADCRRAPVNATMQPESTVTTVTEAVAARPNLAGELLSVDPLLSFRPRTLATTVTGASVLGGDALMGATFLIASGACGEPGSDSEQKLIYPFSSEPFWMLVGNLATVVGIATLLVLVVHAHKLAHWASGNTNVVDPWGTWLFPSIPVLAFSFLYPGIVVGCVAMAVDPASYLTLLAAILGLLVCVSVPVRLWYRVTSDIPRCAAYKSDPTRAKKYHWVIGAGEWVSADARNHWASRYCLVIRPLQPKVVWFFVVDYGVALCIASAHAYPGSGEITSGACGSIKIVSAMAYLSKLLLELHYNPSSRRATGWLRKLVCAVQCVAMSCYAVYAWERRDAALNGTSWSWFYHDNAMRAMIASWILLALRIVLDLFCEVYIVWTCSRQRMQDAEFSVTFDDEVCISGGESTGSNNDANFDGRSGIAQPRIYSLSGGNFGPRASSEDAGNNPLFPQAPPGSATPLLIPNTAERARMDSDVPMPVGMPSVAREPESDDTPADEPHNMSMSERMAMSTPRQMGSRSSRRMIAGATAGNQLATGDEKKGAGAPSATLLPTPSPNHNTRVQLGLRESSMPPPPAPSTSWATGLCIPNFTDSDLEGMSASVRSVTAASSPCGKLRREASQPRSTGRMTKSLASASASPSPVAGVKRTPPKARPGLCAAASESKFDAGKLTALRASELTSEFSISHIDALLGKGKNMIRVESTVSRERSASSTTRPTSHLTGLTSQCTGLTSMLAPPKSGGTASSTSLVPREGKRPSLQPTSSPLRTATTSPSMAALHSPSSHILGNSSSTVASTGKEKSPASPPLSPTLQTSSLARSGLALAGDTPGTDDSHATRPLLTLLQTSPTQRRALPFSDLAVSTQTVDL
eukprot:TRINITY_DN2015_c0_g3_i1.p1 TRINITY_DN2015_c0_g3~~TRINITY_DN2015_c0_g3_i1.p1  ORF type:complete len:1586 (+),score=212.21 TRINITY_DN2015_c0_g3_i1:135-4892(+)